MLLVLSVDEVSAQTSTPLPGFPTPSPGATATPVGGVPASGVTFDFRVGSAGFTSLFGSQVVALGFQTNNEIMDLKGGYDMVNVSQIVLHYSSNADFEVGLELCESDCLGEDPIVYFLYDLELEGCPSGCEYVYSIPSETIGKIKFGFQALALGEPYDDVFVVSSIDVVFESGAVDYDLDGDCPILSPEQIDLLDPFYFASCSRCFVEPTPYRDNEIPTAALPVTRTVNPTLQGTYSIPVISSGTPMTTTPIVVVPAFATATPAPTNTPMFTATPQYDVITYNFRGSNAAGWVGAPWGGDDGTLGADGWMSVYAAVNREYIQINRSASILGVTALTVVYSVPSSLVGGLHFDIFSTNGASILAVPKSDNVTAVGDDLTYTWLFTPAYDFSTGIGINGYSGIVGASDPWYLHEVQIQTSDIVTATPAPTSTPHPTGVAWVPTFEAPDTDCSIASFRDDTPIADFPTNFTVVDYGCYTIVPEVSITLADPDIEINGLSLCITWFQLPLITFLGIAATLDWLLIALAVYLVAMLMRI